MPLQRIITATPSTSLTITSGVIGNINDNNPATKCEVNGTVSPNVFFAMDLGKPYTVVEVDLKGWYENPAGGDVNFVVSYGTAPITSSFLGSAFGSLPLGGGTATPSSSPQNGTLTGSVTAQYWGFVRSGDFSGNQIGVADFNLYINQAQGWLGKFYGG